MCPEIRYHSIILSKLRFQINHSLSKISFFSWNGIDLLSASQIDPCCTSGCSSLAPGGIDQSHPYLQSAPCFNDQGTSPLEASNQEDHNIAEAQKDLG